MKEARGRLAAIAERPPTLTHYEVQTMYSPFSNGTIRQQDIQDRNIARQRISEAIAKEQRRIDILVDTVVNAVEKHGMKMTTVERLWQDIQLDSQLKDIRLRADSNASDYPAFSGWLNGQRLNIETSGRMRLASELNTVVYQERFANTTGFRPAYA